MAKQPHRLMITQAEFLTQLDTHRRILLKVARTYCSNAADREDLVQEIVVQLWRSIGRFDGRSKFSTWMYKVALNVAISYRRSEVARTRYVIADDRLLLNVADRTEPEPDELRRLYDVIEGLNPLDKALVLLYLDGHSYQEMADVLGITATNVGAKVSRLKRGMQARLAEREPEAGAHDESR